MKIEQIIERLKFIQHKVDNLRNYCGTSLNDLEQVYEDGFNLYQKEIKSLIEELENE